MDRRESSTIGRTDSGKSNISDTNAEDREPIGEKKPKRLLLGIVLSVLLVAVISVVAYRPDRPVPTIAPGSSSGPAFVVQIIRPRVGLPLGGLVPPSLFGLEAHLGFDSRSPGATIGHFGPRRLEFVAGGWDLIITLDEKGQVAPETQVVFELEFEDRRRRVRCRAGDPAIGSFRSVALETAGEFSGYFDIELSRCEDAETMEPLGWPSEPLILHGSFDRLRTK